MNLRNKKINKEARRNNVSVDDLANAVSFVQYVKQGNIVDAKVYREQIKEDSPELINTARRVVQFMSDLDAMPGK